MLDGVFEAAKRFDGELAGSIDIAAVGPDAELFTGKNDLLADPEN